MSAWLAGHLWLLAAALILDALTGEPNLLWQRIGHPVAWIGRLIAALDRALNRESAAFAARKAAGVLAIAVVAGLAALAGWAVERLAAALPHGWLLTLLAASVLLAGRSLFDHVRAVAAAFSAGGLAAARLAVSRIVGRDPNALDEPAVCRAAIESAAENFSDGVVAPAFWFAVLGLPGLLAYKAINTADSMIGHRSPRHEAFGWAAARLDDLVNVPASRLAGLLLAAAAPLAGGSPARALAVMVRDAGSHRSPNAGWPEAAMAGALGVALVGPRRYGGRLADDPFLNPEGRREAAPGDIVRALRVGAGAWLALVALAAVGAALLAAFG